jgi:type VI secretion system secreted protein VgrG
VAENKVYGKAGVQLGFYSPALKDGDEVRPVSLLGADGREELSTLFDFDLLLECRGEPLTEDDRMALVTEPCVVALGPRRGDVVHGILTSIVHVHGVRGKVHYYRAKLRPVTHLLTLGMRSAIYQETTIPDLIKTVLGSYGMRSGTDFDVRITDDVKSPVHEYIVQYRESDWAFLSRWMEREGYFYWFVHTDRGSKLVIADANDDATPIADPDVLSYRERNDLATGGASTVWDFRLETRRVPAHVTLVDYNHRRPKELLVTTEKVDERGFGHVYQYGDHFKDGAVGAAWTKIRAQELLSDRQTIAGRTDCARFRVGHTFVLENHYVADYDDTYLITAIEHRVGIPPFALDTPDFEAARADVRGYSAQFRALSAKQQFRPPRRTAWPRIDGVINGHVDADTSGDFAQIDGEGRYKVKLPFDLGERRGLSSSRWIRKAQAYAGTGYGQHFPLHKGAEVLIAHVDGDPDRPVIVGAVANAVTPGTVFDKNATQSVMQTASGIRVELEDSA